MCNSLKDSKILKLNLTREMKDLYNENFTYLKKEIDTKKKKEKENEKRKKEKTSLLMDWEK